VKLENSFTVPAPPEAAWAVLLDVARVAPCMPGATLTEVDGDKFAGTVKVKVGPIGLTYKGTAAFVEKDDATHTAMIDAKGRETRGSGTVNAKITCKLLPDGDGTRVEVVTDLAITGRPAQFGRGVIAEVAGKVITQFAEALSEEIAAGSPTPVAEVPVAEAPVAEAPVAEVTVTDAAEPVAAAESALPDEAEEPTPALTLKDVAAAAAPQAAVEPEAVVTPPAATAPPASPAPQPAPTVVPPAPRRSAEAIDLLDVAGAPVAKRLAPVAVVAALVALIVLLLRKRR
jgi:carbon monoxide dehydrogenase subunit G